MEEEKIPEPSFSSLIMFLATIASQYLGIIKNPISDKVEKNLDLAKYTIDSLTILKEKTKGNLTEEETALFEKILGDLKLTYVREKSKKSNSSDIKKT